MPVNTEQKETMVKEESTNSYAKEESTNSYILSNASKNSSKWSLGKSINQTKSIKGASNDNRNTLTPASPVLKSVSIDAATGITNDSDVTALLYTLSKNMKKLELDVEVRAKYLGEEQQKDIDVRFKQFRDLLALHYTAVARNPSKSVSKKSQENLKEKGLMMRSLNILRKWLRRKRTSTP